MEGVDLPQEAQAQPPWHIWGAKVVFGGDAIETAHASELRRSFPGGVTPRISSTFSIIVLHRYARGKMATVTCNLTSFGLETNNSSSIPSEVLRKQ
jgi:hypothetical protein